MAMTATTDLPLGSKAPDFSLPDPVSGKKVSRNDFSGQPLLVVFMCNHCPYVVHILNQMVDQLATVREQGIASVAISANDVVKYPADSPDKMAALAQEKNFSFPYLYDESQEVAKAYRAECTPDIFLFDSEHELYYHGQFDGSRPRLDTPVTGIDLANAIDALLAGQPAPTDTAPCVGCGIKWR